MNHAKARGARLVMEQLRKTYGGTNAVDDIDLDVAPGEFMTLLGPSGSGKTTTLNMVSGFADVDGGTLTIEGKLVNNIPARLRDIGMVFQNYALFPHMTVADNVAFPLRQRKISKVQRASMVAEVMKTVRLAGFENRFPAQLSGGQQQRVAIARAIVFQPRVLLMDEPLGALDRTLRDGMQLEIRRIHREAGSTVLFVTHDQEEALALSDRIAVFNNGRIEQVGTGEELYENPANVFVAGFLGESTMISGTLKRSGSETVIDHRGTCLQCVAPGIEDATDVSLMIRPEKARLVRTPEDVPPSFESMPVRIVEQVYLGVGRKLSIELPDGSSGMVREPFDRNSNIHPGENAMLTWESSAAKVLR